MLFKQILWRYKIEIKFETKRINGLIGVPLKKMIL